MREQYPILNIQTKAMSLLKADLHMVVKRVPSHDRLESKLKPKQPKTWKWKDWIRSLKYQSDYLPQSISLFTRENFRPKDFYREEQIPL